MTKKAIELIRVSTEGQAQDDRGGIPAQRAANLRTAQVHGLEIVRTFQIEDVSGAKILASPEMQELLRLIEAPEICGCVTREFSRLMRPEDWGDFLILQRFAETRTILYLPDGPVDFSNKSGRLFGGIRALMAGYEREEIRERMNSGKEAIRRAGRHAGGINSLPFGVAWDKRAGWSYTPEAEKVKEAFRQVLTTARPYAQIAAELGIPRTNLRVILQNPIWLGVRVYDTKRDTSAAGYVAGENGRQGYRRKVTRDAAEIVRVKVLPELISESQFNRVQEILADRAARQRIVRCQNGHRFQLNGFLACAECGNPLYTHTSNAGYYICKANSARARKHGQQCANPYVLAEKVEAKIETVLCDKLRDRKAIRQIAQTYLSCSQGPAGVAGVDREASKALIVALQAKRARVLDAFFDGSISKAERDKRFRAIDTELAGCNDMLERAIRQPSAMKVTEQQLAGLLRMFHGFRFLERDDKRLIMTKARARVFTSGYTIARLEMSIPVSIEQSENPSDNSGHIDNRLPAAVASPPARCVETPAARPETKRRYGKEKLRRDAE